MHSKSYTYSMLYTAGPKLLIAGNYLRLASNYKQKEVVLPSNLTPYIPINKVYHIFNILLKLFHTSVLWAYR